MIPQIQIPDFAGGIMRAEQAQASRLQQLAMQRDFEQGQAVDAALANGGAAALFGADDAARDSVLSRLAGAGRAGLGVAMPIFQQRQQRVTPMTPEQAAALGLRPGTVAMVDGLGRPQVIQTPDTASPEAEAQKLRIAAAGRQPPAPTVLGPGQVAFGRDGQVVATGPARPAESPFEANQGGDAQILADLGPLVASGQATPAQQRLYSIAATRWQSSGQQMAQIPDPNTPGGTLQVAIPRPLPPGFPAPPPLSAPVAPPAAAPAGAAPAAPAGPAPQQQGGVTIPGTTLTADPNSPRAIASTPVSPQAREAARTAEQGAGRVLDAINNFRAALEPFRGATGMAAYNPRSIEGQRLASAYEILKMAMRDETLLNTGVLQPGENVMIERMLRSPASVMGVLSSIDSYNTMLDEFSGFVQRGTNRVRGTAQLPPIDWTQQRPGTTPDPRGGNRPNPLNLQLPGAR